MHVTTESEYRKLPDESKTLLRQFMFVLPERQRKAFTMRSEGKSFEDIGAALGVKSGRAGEIYRDALWRLARAVEADKARNILSQLNDTEGASIKILPLSVRTYNSLRNAGIDTMGQLLSYAPRELLKRARGFGKKSLKELQQVLTDMALSLKGNS